MTPKKRVCKRCFHIYPSWGDVICTHCRIYENYIQSHPKIATEITILPWLHFDFEPHGLALVGKSVNANILGSVQVDPINRIAHVRLSLYEFKDMMPDECFSECVRVLTHEFNHWAIYETTNNVEIMSRYDNTYYRELEAWLNE